MLFFLCQSLFFLAIHDGIVLFFISLMHSIFIPFLFKYIVKILHEYYYRVHGYNCYHEYYYRVPGYNYYRVHGYILFLQYPTYPGEA